MFKAIYIDIDFFISNHIFTSFERDIKLDFELIKLLFIAVKINPSKIGIFTLWNESFVH